MPALVRAPLRLLVALGVAVVLVAVAVVIIVVVQRDGDETPAAKRESCIRDAELGAASATTQPPVADPARGVPVRLRIPSIDVDAEVLPVSMDAEGRLLPPADVSRIGWWAQGAEPGSPYGTVLCTGHSVHRGGGVFDRLPDVEVGAAVGVVTENGTVDYRVTDVREYSKSTVAELADRLFSQDVSGRLVLVTCSDYRRGEYRGNTLVFAEPAPRPDASAG